MSKYVNDFLMWAASDPYSFLFYVLLILAPFFAISAFLSWKLSVAIKNQEKEMSRRQKMAKELQAKKKER